MSYAEPRRLSSRYLWIRNSLASSALVLGGLVAIPTLVHAQAASTTHSTSAAISQSFDSTQADIALGALVSLDQGGNNKVSPASTDSTNALVGIVDDNSLIEVDGGGAAKLQIVTDGVTEALVSDINGDVKVGDNIGASPVRGIGMRQTATGQIVGIAQAGLSEADTTTREITGKDGTKVSIRVGRIPVRVHVSYFATDTNSATDTTKTNTSLIERIGNAVAGRETSTIRITTAFTLLAMGFIIMVVILRTAVAASLTSIGRNPLSSDAIHKNFNAVALIALGVLLVSLSTAYLALVV